MKQNSDIKTVVAIERHSYWLFREIKYETNPENIKLINNKIMKNME